MISFSVSQIAELVKGKLTGDGNRPILGAAGLLEASETDLSFFHNPKYIDDIISSKAAAILIPEKLNGELPIQNKTVIQVANPQWAFAQVLGIIEKIKRHHPQGIHPSAVISPAAKIGNRVAIGAHVVVESGTVIGDNTVVYPGCYIGEGSTVGSDCLFYSHVVLREDVHIGDRVIMHPGVVLGSDGYGFATVQGIHQKIPQIGKVVIENDVEIGANVTVDRATTGETRIGAGTKIDNLVHIAHNVHVGKGCLIVAQVGISGSTTIGNYVTLAGQVGITGHLTIGDGAIIAAQSGIMNDVKPKEVLFGSPGRPIKEAMKLQALYGKLPDLYDAFKAMKKKILPPTKE